jgi:hypothetical protein
VYRGQRTDGSPHERSAYASTVASTAPDARCDRIHRFTSSVAAPREALKYRAKPPQGATVTATALAPCARVVVHEREVLLDERRRPAGREVAVQIVHAAEHDDVRVRGLAGAEDVVVEPPAHLVHHLPADAVAVEAAPRAASPQDVEVLAPASSRIRQGVADRRDDGRRSGGFIGESARDLRQQHRRRDHERARVCARARVCTRARAHACSHSVIAPTPAALPAA